MLELLNIMDGFEGKPALNSAEYIHRAVEAMKLVYADRDTYYGDPKFNHIPTEVLLSKEYAAERRRQITRSRFAGVSAGQDQRKDRPASGASSIWRTSRSTMR